MSWSDNFYCRLCALLLPRNKLIDLLLEEENHAFIEKLIHINATIDSFEETLPKTVCFNCIILLDQAFDFVVQVGKAQDLLRNKYLVQNLKTEDVVLNVDHYDFKYDDFHVEEEVIVKNEVSDIDDCGNEGYQEVSSELKIEDKVLEINNDSVRNKEVFITKEVKANDNVPEVHDCGNKFVSNKEVSITKEKKVHENFSEVNNFDCEFLNNEENSLEEEIKTEAFEVEDETFKPALNENPAKIDAVNVTTESVIKRKPKVAKIKTESNLDISLSCPTWHSVTWLCSICDTQFNKLTSLQEHSMSHHNTCNSYRCVDCRKRTFNIDKFVTHVSTHRKHLRLSCYQCSETFKKINSLKEHSKVHISSDFVCRGCNMCFKSEEEFTKHKEKYYRATSKVRLIPEKLKQDSLTCKICGKTSSSKMTQISHLLTHTDRSRNHICEVCGKPFLRKYDLDRHMFTHTKGLFQCTICQSRFNTIESLHNHKSLHENVKPFPCKICGKKFRLQGQVNYHQVVHSASYPFKCPVCGKGFNYKHRMQEHERQHSGAMPFSCDICKKSFRDGSNFSKHMKYIHNRKSKRKTYVTNVPDNLKKINEPLQRM